MFESTPFIKTLIRRDAVDEHVTDSHLVALVNEARSDGERRELGRSATARVRLARRRAHAEREGASTGAARLRRWASLRA